MEVILNKVETDFDIQKTAETAKEIWTEHFTPIIGAEQVEYMLEKFQSIKAIRNQIMHEGYTYLNVIDNGNIIGYTGFKKEESRMFLSKLYVKKEYRGYGISRMMLDEIIKCSPGMEGIYLTVNKHNYNTIEIYKHMGFKIIDSVETDIGNGFIMDDYILQLNI